MPSFSTLRFVPYTPTEMFAIVSDVEHYPEFVPLCEGLKVLSREPQNDGTTVLIATMSVGYKAIRESFTTRVLLTPEKPEILVEYLTGPFSHLENRWRFLARAEGTDVDFFIDYKFRSPILALVAGGVFDQAFHRLSEAFEERAQKIHGPRTAQQSLPPATP